MFDYLDTVYPDLADLLRHSPGPGHQWKSVKSGVPHGSECSHHRRIENDHVWSANVRGSPFTSQLPPSGMQIVWHHVTIPTDGALECCDCPQCLLLHLDTPPRYRCPEKLLLCDCARSPCGFICYDGWAAGEICRRDKVSFRAGVCLGHCLTLSSLNTLPGCRGSTSHRPIHNHHTHFHQCVPVQEVTDEAGVHAPCYAETHTNHRLRAGSQWYLPIFHHSFNSGIHMDPLQDSHILHMSCRPCRNGALVASVVTRREGLPLSEHALLV